MQERPPNAVLLCGCRCLLLPVTCNADKGRIPHRLREVSELNKCSGTVAPRSSTDEQEDAVGPLLDCLFDKWYPKKEKEFRAASFGDVVVGQSLGYAGPTNELGSAAFAKLLNSLNAFGEALSPSDSLAVLGSGLGQTLLQALLTSDVSKAIGVEQAAKRHHIAQVARRFALGVAQSMLAVGYDGKVYAQAARLMSPETEWTLAGNGSLDGVDADDTWVYGINKEDRRVYRQRISELSPSSEWELLSEGPCLDIAIDGDIMYGAMMDGCIWKQNLTALPHPAKNVSAWQKFSGPHVVSVAISNGTVYGDGGSGDLWKQELAEVNTTTPWSRVSHGRVESVTAHSTRLYGVPQNLMVYVQDARTISNASAWYHQAKGNVMAVAVTETPVPALLDQVVPPLKEQPLRHNMLTLLNADIVNEAAVSQWSSSTVIYVASLTMLAPEMLQLGWVMSQELEAGTFVYTQQRFPGCYQRLLQVGVTRLQTTWSLDDIDVFMYVVLPHLAPKAVEPVWLASTAAPLSLALLGSQCAVGRESTSAESCSRSEWVQAATNAWSSQAPVQLWRLLIAVATWLGLPTAEMTAAVPLSSLNAVIGILHDDSTGRARVIRCASSALKARRNLTNESLPTSLPAVVERMRDINLQDGDGRTLLWWIAGAADSDLAASVAKKLLDFGARSELLDSTGFGPLGRAAAAGNTHVVQLLLEKGVDAALGAGPDAQPAGLAAANGHFELLQMLQGGVTGKDL